MHAAFGDTESFVPAQGPVVTEVDAGALLSMQGLRLAQLIV